MIQFQVWPVESQKRQRLHLWGTLRNHWDSTRYKKDEGINKRGESVCKSREVRSSLVIVARWWEEFMPEIAPNSADQEPLEGFQQGNVSAGFAFQSDNSPRSGWMDWRIHIVCFRRLTLQGTSAPVPRHWVGPAECGLVWSCGQSRENTQNTALWPSHHYPLWTVLWRQELEVGSRKGVGTMANYPGFPGTEVLSRTFSAKIGKVLDKLGWLVNTR